MENAEKDPSPQAVAERVARRTERRHSAIAGCKHGLNPRSCDPCRCAKEAEPLPADAVRLTSGGQPAIVLRLQPESKTARVLVLEGQKGEIVTVDESALRANVLAGEPYRALLDLFHSVALEGGCLFHPNGPLTSREQAYSPPSCHECRTELSFEKASLGCRQCLYYVCGRGHCLCGYTGWNYLGQPFSQRPGPPIRRAERLDYVRVVRLCTHST